ncbi:ankyrin repeat-containing protein [Planoprotostelium fungivorum]|uniref:Ankyrin repeat-containing protein n=1 Tax=Planoprotostelium fungivorum TaxID=1890364 RepID=A0A2P6NM17_9EUKA|nr:ankyrin repeat-containing protein [Planoprotostelium fungivorum]
MDAYIYEFFEAARDDDVQRLKNLIAKGVDVNVADEDTGSTALHVASLKGRRQVIEYLVGRGANVNVQNLRGVTPLYYLGQGHYTALAIFLICNGARLDIKCQRGWTVLDVTPKHVHAELFSAVEKYQLQVQQKKAGAPSPLLGQTVKIST